MSGEDVWPPHAPQRRPKTLLELFQFYSDYLKPIYAYMQTRNVMASELLVEVNAAFDHLSRLWVYNEPEAHVVAKVYSHLKRACLDIFKLRLVETTDNYKKLCRLDVSLVDNGRYKGAMISAHMDIERLATLARSGEGDVRQDDHAAVRAFDLWEPVFLKCAEFDEQFYAHPAVYWSDAEIERKKRKGLKIAFGLGFLASLAATATVALISLLVSTLA